MIVDECHHIPAAAFEHAVKQIPARRWLGLTATPYRRDQLDELIALQLGPVRHTITAAPDGTLSARGLNAPRPTPALHVHATDYRYLGDANPSEPGGISTIYEDLAADVGRNQQIVADVVAAHARGRHCLVLTQWVDHLITLDALLRERDLDPVVLRGGTGAKARAAALSRLDPATSDGPLLVVAGSPVRRPDPAHLPPARPTPKSTTTTTCSPACLPRHSPSAHRATPAWASRALVGSHLDDPGQQLDSVRKASGARTPYFPRMAPTERSRPLLFVFDRLRAGPHCQPGSGGCRRLCIPGPPSCASPV